MSEDKDPAPATNPVLDFIETVEVRAEVDGLDAAFEDASTEYRNCLPAHPSPAPVEGELTREQAWERLAILNGYLALNARSYYQGDIDLSEWKLVAKEAHKIEDKLTAQSFSYQDAVRLKPISDAALSTLDRPESGRKS